MKIIDILNKIANGEQPPKKIIFRNVIYDYDEEEGDYYNNEYDAIFDYHEITDILNEEVQVLETTITYKPDKIEKLYECYIHTDNEVIKFLIQNINQMKNKINEIIEKVNSL